MTDTAAPTGPRRHVEAPDAHRPGIAAAPPACLTLQPKCPRELTDTGRDARRACLDAAGSARGA